MTVSSIISLVVPAISETMALSSFKRAFNSVDLPTLGRPIIATGTPFFITLPTANESISRFKTTFIFSSKELNFSLSANSTSSSPKSNSSSMREAKLISSSRNTFNSLENPPRIWCIATLCADSFSDEIRSATASACDKSIFPFEKARRVNSPAFAILAPAPINSWMSWF